MRRTLSLFILVGTVSCIIDDDDPLTNLDASQDLWTISDQTASETPPSVDSLLDTQLPSPDLANGSNSGQTCDQNTPCPTADESCFSLPGWTRGMCFGQCANQGDICPTPDPAKYFSQCAVAGQNPGSWYCLYICDFKGLSYECPDPATQECVVSTTAGTKVCKPK